MHSIRLLDPVGKANKYLVIQTLLCEGFFQLLYMCILQWKYICNVTYSVPETRGSRTCSRVAHTWADIPTSLATLLPICFSQNSFGASAFLRQTMLDFSPNSVFENFV